MLTPASPVNGRVAGDRDTAGRVDVSGSGGTFGTPVSDATTVTSIVPCASSRSDSRNEGSVVSTVIVRFRTAGRVGCDGRLAHDRNSTRQSVTV